MKTVIIDLDGVCFDSIPRLERCKDETGQINWDRAFSDAEVSGDLPLVGAAEATRKIENEFMVIYLTGRSTKCMLSTIGSLGRYNFANKPVMMRMSYDTRPDDKVKREHIENLKVWNFVAAIDDDYSGKLKPMYESLGIPHFCTFEEFFQSAIWKETQECTY
tara:strand:+ start:326 stop:811 length:486 start_codon:yes stop_codon:yes gene_type:complete